MTGARGDGSALLSVPEDGCVFRRGDVGIERQGAEGIVIDDELVGVRHAR